MLSWWHWLWSSDGLPPEGVGWPAGLVRWTVASHLAIAVAYCSVAVLLFAFAWRSPNGVNRGRRRWLTLGFTALVTVAAAMQTCRAASYTWPLYHLQVTLNLLTAGVAISVVWVLAPLVLGGAWQRSAEENIAVADRLDEIATRLGQQEERILLQSQVDDARMKVLAQLMEEAQGAGQRPTDAGPAGSE